MNSPTSTDATNRRDFKRRFIFEQMDVRGEIVHLDRVLDDVNAIHDYPAGVATLLGEFLTAAVLLASTLKFRGSLTVQARSDREIPLIMAECSSELTVRGIVRGAQQALSQSFAALLGGGQLAFTVTPERGKRYQGIVPLSDDSLAASIDHYFGQSEQLPTRIHLASDGRNAAGMLLQQLPAQLQTEPGVREEQWQRLSMLADTLSPTELLQTSDETVLYRLFHEETLRLYDPEPVSFRCSCSRDRTLAALSTIGESEIRSILEEQGSVTMDCEFCNQRYVFSEDELQPLIGPAEGNSIH
jgi:molecular chaperone Hsp33